MAQSPTHKFGQVIGDLIEEILHRPLAKIAKEHDLYLDFKHARPARRNRKKVTWSDHKHNKHDLDYVLERGGSEAELGTPVAFIECAWRRYTKHSRNKAQEIQGAVRMLADTYGQSNPFLGVVLAGVFTEGSLQQLRSHGFSIVYCSYETVIAAFAKVGIDADFDEETPDAHVRRKVRQFEALSAKQRAKLIRALRSLVHSEFEQFKNDLEASLKRKVERIVIATLHGRRCELASVQAAVEFIDQYSEDSLVDGFVRYEVMVRYSNGDRVDAQFHDKENALQFLQTLVQDRVTG